MWAMQTASSPWRSATCCLWPTRTLWALAVLRGASSRASCRSWGGSEEYSEGLNRADAVTLLVKIFFCEPVGSMIKRGRRRPRATRRTPPMQRSTARRWESEKDTMTGLCVDGLTRSNCVKVLHSCVLSSMSTTPMLCAPSKRAMT